MGLRQVTVFRKEEAAAVARKNQKQIQIKDNKVRTSGPEEVGLIR